MSLLYFYQAQINANKILLDDKQIDIIKLLQLFKEEIEAEYIKYQFWVHRFIFNFTAKWSTRTTANQGFYLYSGVGRGKTMLMDLFFNHLQLPETQKYRVHFHLFMRSIHVELQRHSGIKNPIDYIIRTKYQSFKIICLDEFLVHDIADAMILARVIHALFKYNIKLITTSNLPPSQLYKNGLQRELFMPAITAIENNLNVLHLGGELDYRAQMLLETTCFFSNDPVKDKELMGELFIKFTNKTDPIRRSQIDIASRKIDVVAVSNNIVWFDFTIICNSPRSQHDYLEIAEIYKVVFISNVVSMDDSKNDIVRRFISLIDIVYDYNVKLIISSAVAMEDLYVGSALAFEFDRTISRLKEMQTQSYLARVHL